jgi:hypothetical protein
LPWGLRPQTPQEYFSKKRLDEGGAQNLCHKQECQGCLDTCYQKQAVARRMAQRFEDRLPITVMITWSMAKKAALPASSPSGARRRGRPPKPGGRLSQVEIQRAYRARLAAAGKVVKIVKIVNAATVSPAPVNPALAVIQDFDPARDGIYERTTVETMREDLHNALSKLELRNQDVERLEARNVYLEGELRLEHQHHTNAIKANIVLKKQLAEITQKPAKRRPI